MTEPIFEHIRRELSDAEHTIASLIHHPRYHHTNDAPPEAPVDLTTIENDVRGAVQDVISHAESAIATGKQLLDTHLPALAAAAEKAQASPIAQALENWALGPEDEQMIATLIDKLGAYAAAHAQAAAGTGVPPEASEAPAVVPAGPQVGGQA